jgi:hypothetical protein
MSREHMVLALATAALAGALAYAELAGRSETAARGNPGRQVPPPSIRGAALDASLGMVTPDHLQWWGPKMRPPEWIPHRVRYSLAPGQEIERLIFGAPGCCNTALPRAQRGWMFAPPSNEDI